MRAEMHNYSTWVEETEPSQLKSKYIELLKNSGFGVLQIIEKHFEPYGYTLLVLLSESHFALHTFPEEQRTYIELTSCIKKQFDNFINNGARPQ